MHKELSKDFSHLNGKYLLYFYHCIACQLKELSFSNFIGFTYIVPEIIDLKYVHNA